MAVDKIDAAIAAAGAPAQKAESFPLTTTTGKRIGLLVPADLTPAEALEMVAWIGGDMLGELEKRRAANRRSPIQVFRGTIPKG